ncbi:hypothetical protein [Xenophilus azovorans]|uniref:hypothetical protein n=1 Tax=Xenophilus azovorans TaxID=151755 RepID=UPI0012ED0787|nr:hypothetical protein [Xenophilus azovorans]
MAPIKGMLPRAPDDFPLSLFRTLRDSGDIKAQHDAEKELIERDVRFDGWRPLMLAILDTCASCALAARSPEHHAWKHVSRGKDQAAVALAHLVHSAEEAHRRRATARKGKEAQAKGNEQIRLRVLEMASMRERKETISSAVKGICTALRRDHGGLIEALDHYGSTIKRSSPNDDDRSLQGRMEKTFRDFIERDMIRLGVRAEGEKLSPAEIQQRFFVWKKKYPFAKQTDR